MSNVPNYWSNYDKSMLEGEYFTGMPKFLLNILNIYQYTYTFMYVLALCTRYLEKILGFFSNPPQPIISFAYTLQEMLKLPT